MRERLRQVLMRMLRVPGPPQPPADEPGPVQLFRAAPGYLRYAQVFWLGKQLGALAGLIAGLAFIASIQGATENLWIRYGLWAIETFAWAGFLLQLPASWLMLRLDYDMRWYIVSGRSLRIREGLLSVREQTLAYANIQQISTRQGPLQRLFGIADVEVRTAGGGGAESGKGDSPLGADMHVGHFRGVSNAAEIRELLRERVGRHRDAGLGDPDDANEPLAVAAVAGAPAAAGGTLIDAARELTAAARELRAARG